MHLIEFVKKHLKEHRVKGKEILVKTCPYCGGDKYKFSINTEKGLYQCFRGSCRETGHVDKLYRKFKEEVPNLSFKNKKLDIKDYCKKNTVELTEYFKTRGISKETLDKNIFDIMSTKTNEISFIYRKAFEVHSIKVRGIKEKRFTAKKLKEITLWKLDFCDTEKELIICEGEIDQLSFEEQGIYNAVSVPQGASALGWIDTDFEELEKFKTVVLAFDNDKAGIEARNKIIKRLPEQCEVKIVDFLDYKDANEVLLGGGNLQDYLNASQTIEEDYVVKMVSLDSSKPLERFSSGSLTFNRAVGGGRFGEVSIFTGQAGSGKSTILDQLGLNAAEQNIKCGIYTPELTDRQFKEWTCRQLLRESKGSFNKSYCKTREKEIFTVKKEISDKMSIWLDDWFINITGRKNLTDKELLKIITRQIKKNNVRFFIIDNLMKVIFEGSKDEYTMQKEFLNKLSEIAKIYNVSINLVAHPKKHDRTQPDQYDIAGSSNIPNLVDNIYYFRRITDWCLNNDLKGDAEQIEDNDISTLMMVLKSREGEKIGTWHYFQFDVNRKSINAPGEKISYLEKWTNYKKFSDDDIPEF